jgi:hypothetical protein
MEATIVFLVVLGIVTYERLVGWAWGTISPDLNLIIRVYVGIAVRVGPADIV